MIPISRIRTSLIFFGLLSGFVIILIHLYILQIKNYQFFTNLGKQQYTITIKSNPPRALIYDRNNQLLALNQDSLSAFVLPKQLESKNQLEHFLKQHFPQALERLKKHADANFLYLKRKLSPEQITLIKQSSISDIKLLKEPNRFYTNDVAGHIIGITDIDNNGLFGIELLFNEQLAGTPTTLYLEKDARSGFFHFNKETKVEGKEGTPIQLTIDSTLQFLAYEELKQTMDKFKAKEGAILIMNPTNGEILAMVQYPTFDPNQTQQLPLEHTKNKIVTECYEFGSVIKIFLALAALQEHVVQPDELIDCQNTKVGYVNGVKISTWPHGHGLITFQEVIQHSNNIGVATVALRLGPQLYEHYRRVGFGTKTGLNWPGEQKGYVNPPHKWTRPSLISLSFGYEITANLLQLARAFSVIANKGVAIKPKIIMSNDQLQPITAQPLYDAATLEQIETILEKTVQEGTARKAALKGYKVLAKTGTANLVIDGVYNTQHNIYTCAGIIEKDDYKRLIVTFINDAQGNNLYASSVSVPLFESVAERLVIHDHIIA